MRVMNNSIHSTGIGNLLTKQMTQSTCKPPIMDGFYQFNDDEYLNTWNRKHVNQDCRMSNTLFLNSDHSGYLLLINVYSNIQ